MTGQLSKINEANPDAIIVFGASPGPEIINKNARQLGIKAPLYIFRPDSVKKYIELAGPAAEGATLITDKLSVFEAIPNGDYQYKQRRAYLAAYKDAYGNYPSSAGGYVYDSFLIITEALKATGGAAGEKVRDYVEHITDFAGIIGTYTMSPKDHNGVFSVYETAVVKGGTVVLVK